MASQMTRVVVQSAVLSGIGLDGASRDGGPDPSVLAMAKPP
jgi:hypothetical protein